MGVRFYLQTVDYMNVSQPQCSEDAELLHVFIGMHVKMLSDSFLYGNVPIVLTVKGMMSGGGWQYLRLTALQLLQKRYSQNLNCEEHILPSFPPLTDTGWLLIKA